MKANELESRLELEKTTRSRLEVQFNRYKDALEKAQQEASATKAKEQTAQDALKKVQKSLRLVYTISLRIDNSTRIKFTISVFFLFFLLSIVVLFGWIIGFLFQNAENYARSIIFNQIVKMIMSPSAKTWNKRIQMPKVKYHH